jgi:hypothetical protein
VFAVCASGIRAWQEEQRWGVVDDDPPDVRASFGDARAILDLELETDQVRHFFTKPRCVVFASASLRKS